MHGTSQMMMIFYPMSCVLKMYPNDLVQDMWELSTFHYTVRENPKLPNFASNGNNGNGNTGNKEPTAQNPQETEEEKWICECEERQLCEYNAILCKMDENDKQKHNRNPKIFS